MKKYIETGKIVGPHGLKGEVKIIPWCDDPYELSKEHEFYLDDEGRSKITITRARVHKNVIILEIDKIDNINMVDELINKIIYINRDHIKLLPGECLQSDLIGINVEDIDNGTKYGIIYKISQTGANDVYYIKSDDGKELLIPAIKDVVKHVDIENKIMLIKPLEGLLDL
jgi:16S rRNA processing protein RimM